MKTKIPKSSFLYRLLARKNVFEADEAELASLIMIGKVDHKKDVFSFKHIGEVIQDLLNGFYKHRFTSLPYKSLTKIQCEKILNETVKF
jgi:hypothetical protein